METPTQKLWLGASTLFVVGLAIYGGFSGLGVGLVNISDIRQKWKAYSTVQIQGEVSDRVQLLGEQVYEVADSTGAIWVLTQAPVPNLGDQVLIEGKVRYENISINAEDLGEAYLVEEKRLKAEPAKATSEQ